LRQAREARRAELVKRYKELARKGARCILDLAATLREAAELPGEIDAFCKEVGLDPKGSTYRKLIAISDRLARFEPLAERMPCAWTTIYQLAKLSDEAFERIARSDRFGPLMTARDVESIVQSVTPIAKVTKRDVVPAPAKPTLAKPPTTDEEDIAPETIDEESVAVSEMPTKKTVSDVKSLMESSTRAAKRTERVNELGDSEIWLDLSDLGEGGKMTVLHAIRKLHREHGFRMDTGDGLTRLERRFRDAA
jgi:hypothetical protein